jgi:hypothetical protein
VTTVGAAAADAVARAIVRAVLMAHGVEDIPSYGEKMSQGHIETGAVDLLLKVESSIKQNSIKQSSIKQSSIKQISIKQISMRNHDGRV